MTDPLLALGHAHLNGLSNEHLVFEPFYLGTLLFAGQRGGGQRLTK